jgi:hypothetical protein
MHTRVPQAGCPQRHGPLAATVTGAGSRQVSGARGSAEPDTLPVPGWLPQRSAGKGGKQAGRVALCWSMSVLAPFFRPRDALNPKPCSHLRLTAWLRRTALDVSNQQGDWNFRWMHWLPLQVLTFVLTCHGALRHQVSVRPRSRAHCWLGQDGLSCGLLTQSEACASCNLTHAVALFFAAAALPAGNRALQRHDPAGGGVQSHSAWLLFAWVHGALGFCMLLQLLSADVCCLGWLLACAFKSLLNTTGNLPVHQCVAPPCVCSCPRVWLHAAGGSGFRV